VNAIPDVALSPDARAEPIREYINLYVRQIISSVWGRQSCLLLGPLGAGKTTIIHASAIQLHKSGLARCVVMNIGEDTQLSPETLWSSTLKALDALPRERLTLVELRARVREWLQRQCIDLVLMLDQVELLERTGPVFDEIRAMVMETAQASGSKVDDEDDAGRFVAVLSSTEALRRDLTSPHSPLHNILEIIRMLDCEPALRESIWDRALAQMPLPQRRVWSKELDRLCGGDPYQMLRAIEALDHEWPAMLLRRDFDTQMMRLFAEFNANPAQVAPLLRRHGEQVENDEAAASAMLELLQNRRVPAGSLPQADNDSVRSGIFRRNHAGEWVFRSGLTERFFRNEFERRPERVAMLLMRQSKYEQAIQHLGLHKQTGRDVTSVLRDVCLAWVRTARSPSLAWDTVARALSHWFGEGVMVLRSVPRWRAMEKRQHYALVRYGVYDLPADMRIESLARDAYTERTSIPSSGIVLKPIPFFKGQPDDCAVFPMQHHAGEFGAIVLSRAAYEAELDVHPDHTHDHLDTWVALLNDIFDEIAGMEQELLSNVDLASVQRLAQEHRGLADADWVLGMVLAAITAGFGLKFNRCVLLQATGESRLVGRAAVGFHSQAEQERAWRNDIPETFAGWLNQYPVGSAFPSTPLGRATHKFHLDNWRDDAVLARAMSSDALTSWPAQRVAESAVGRLMHLDGATAGDTSVFILPLLDGDVRVGALLLDRPFTRESVTQEQLDLLPGFANQLVLTLGNERVQRDYQLFDALNAATHRRLMLQETLEAICTVLMENLSGLVTQVVISLWERSAEPSASDPDRRQSTVRLARSATRGDLIGDDWQYFYYAGHERCHGPIDQALFEAGGRLDIPNLSRWLEQRKPDAGPHFSRGIRTVYSVAMQAGQPQPLGVISYQSSVPNAFNKNDQQRLDRLASRIAGMVDKARVYEGLSNARHHTDQLNQALDQLMQQRTRADLHDHIVKQMSDFFFGDGRGAHHNVKPDSTALFAVHNDGLARVAGAQPDLAERLARECNALRERAIAGQAVFIEYAGSELVAREAFGREVCRRHMQLGAQASVWCTIGADLLLVMAWERPRRISATERESLPVLTAIAARTNGVIERDRQAMKTRLANSLSLGDYEMIEAEYSHQWNKRIRAIRNNAQYALDALERGGAPADELRAQLENRLAFIRNTSTEGLERLSFSSKVTKEETIQLRPWLADLVMHWNMLNSSSEIPCALDLQMPADAALSTRPVILQWILHELLGNALDAEMRLRAESRRIELRAAHHSHQREFEIAISNTARLPRDVLEAIRSNSPIDRPNSSGRGIWIAAGQVQALLGGTLTSPDPQDARTTFTLTLPQ
jgi:hypothetical protein